MKKNIKITVFTPTYNRNKLLKRCKESLDAQTCKNFEWLIVDDGSTDGTRSVVKEFSKNSNYHIKYIFQENSGKYIAHNTAVKNCATDYLLILDSDDILSPVAIEILYKKINEINSNQKIAGIIGNRGDFQTHKIIGTKLPKNIQYTTGLQLYQRYKFKGDTLRMYKTDILKKYLFPIIQNESFIPENVVFDQIDKRYQLLAIPEVIYFTEYQQEGYSKNICKIRHNNPIGYSYSLKSAAETAVVFRKKINWTILYIIWCKNFKIKNFNTFRHKVLYILLYPISMILNWANKPSFLFKSIKGINNEE